MLIDAGFSYELVFALLLISLATLILINSFVLIRSRTHRFDVDRPLGGKKRKLFILFNALFITACLFSVYDLFIKPASIQYNSVAESSYWGYDGQPIEIVYDRAFKTDSMQPQIQPPIKGRWESTPSILPFLSRKLTFHPEQTLMPGEKLALYLGNVWGIVGNQGNTQEELEISSPPIPEVDLENSNPRSNDLGVSTNSEIIIKLTSFDGNFVDWLFQMTPTANFEVIRNNSTEIKLKLREALSQGSKYNLKITRTVQALNVSTNDIVLQNDPVQVGELVFTTLQAPVLTQSEPKGDMASTDSVIKLVFDKPMLASSVESKLRVEPGFEFGKSWTDDKTLVIQPNSALEKGTTYKIIVATGAVAADGGALEQEIIHQFSTIGVVKVLSTSPVDNSKNLGTGTQIKVEFNQEVDRASAQSHFSISPAVSGNFSWSGNTLTFAPSSLRYNTKYEITVQNGIKSIKGLNGNSNFKFDFTTRLEQIALNVPLYIQPYRYACNLTAARMALAYRGVNVSVDTLYSQIAKDNTSYDSSSNTWGNPNAGYVGDLRGVSRGYGVHWSPVSSLISRYRSNTVKTGWNLTDLLKEVEAGNPVIIWAHNGSSGAGTDTSWNLPGGGRVHTIQSMHSYLVRGFTGNPENPSQIIINDSNHGHVTMTPSYFNSLWNTMGKSAIVVR